MKKPKDDRLSRVMGKAKSKRSKNWPKSLFGMPIRVIKKGKKRGRPSKFEITLSKLVSWHMESPEMKKAIEQAQMDMLTHGIAVVPTKWWKARP